MTVYNEYSWGLFYKETCPWAYIDAFSKEECEQIKSYCYENLELLKGKTFDTDEERSKQVRKSNISWLPQNDNTEWVFRRFAEITDIMNERWFRYDLDYIESLQFTEYKHTENGHYGFHVDSSVHWETYPRKLSFSLILSDLNEYDGGEMEFMYGTKGELVKKDQGTVLFFPSFLLHRVCPVTAGTRNSLVGWVCGKPFK